MAVTIFSCPKCKATMKSARLLAPGTKVKCPKCTAIFALPERNGAAAPATKTNPLGSEKDWEKKPAGKIRRPPDDDGAVAAYDDDDEDEDEIERKPKPKRKKGIDRPTSKIKRKKQKMDVNRILLIVFSIVGLILVGGGTWFTGYVWPAFFLPEEPLAYIPENSNVVLSLNFGDMGGDGKKGTPAYELITLSFSKMLDFAPERCEAQTGLKLTELFDRVVVGTTPGSGGAEGKDVFVFKAKKPFDQEKIETFMRLRSSPQKQNGKDYYKKYFAGKNYALFFASSQTIVLSELLDKDLEAIMNVGGKKPAIKGDLLAQVEDGRKNHISVAILFDDKMKENLRKVLAAVPAGQDTSAAKRAADKAKTACVKVNIDENAKKINVQAGFECGDDAAAGQVTKDLQNLWNTYTKGIIFGPLIKSQIEKLPPNMQTLANEILNNTKFTTESNVARVSTHMGLAGVLEILQQAQNILSTVNFGSSGQMIPGTQPGTGPGNTPPPGGRRRGGRGGPG